jgi:chromosome segregation ATPase
MYKCNTCDAEYSNQKKYLKHIDLCGSDIRSTNSLGLTDVEDERNYRSKSRSRSQRSIVEVNDVSTKNMIEKLVKDKARYKAEIKALKKQVDSQQFLNKNNDDFLNQQLVLITEERDDLLEQIEQFSSNEPIIKERLRLEFSKKLAQEKAKIIENFNSKELDNSKIKHELAMLETKLENAYNEKEQLKLSSETEIKLITTKFNNQFQQLQEETNMAKQNVQQERLNHQKQIQLFNDEKATEIINLKKEKDQDYEHMKVEKLTIINGLEEKLKRIEKENTDIKDSSKKAIEDNTAQCELEISKISKENENIHKNFQIKLERQNEINQGLIQELQNSFDQEKNSLEAIKNKEINNIHQDYKIRNNEEVNKLTEEILKLNNKIKIMSAELENNESQNKKEAELSNNKYNESIAQLKVNHQNEIDELKQTIKKENLNEITEKNNAINELMITNGDLANKINNLQNTLQNMEKDSVSTKEEFITNLNTQIEKHEKEVSELKNTNSILTKDFNKQLSIIKTIKEDSHREIENIRQSNSNYQQESIKTKQLSEDLQNKNQGLQNQVHHLMRQIEEIQSKLIENSTQRTIYEVQSKNNEEIISKYQNNIEHLEKRLDSKQKEIEQYIENCNNLKIKLMETETNSKGVNTENEMIKNVIVQNELQYKEMVKKCDKLLSEKEDDKRRFSELSQSNSLLGERQVLLEQQCQQLNLNCSSAHQTIQSLQAEVADKNLLDKNCKEKEEELENTKTKLQNTLSNMSILTNKLNSVQQELNNVSKLKEELGLKNESYVNDLSILQKEISANTNYLQEAKREKMNSDHKEKSLLDRLNELQDQKDSLTKENGQLKQVNQNFKESLENNKTKIRSLTQELQSTQQSLNQVNNEKEEAMKKSSHHQNMLQQLNKNNQSLFSQLKNKNTEELDQLKNQHEQSITENVQKIEHLETVIKKIKAETIAKLGQQSEQLKGIHTQQIQEKDQAIANLTEQIKQTKEEVINQLNNQRKEIMNHYTGEISNYKEQLEVLKNEKERFKNINNELGQKLRDTLDNSQNEIEIEKGKKDKTISELQNEINHLNTIISSNKQDYQDNLSKITNLSNTEKIELEALRNDIINKNSMLDELKSFTSDLQTKYNLLEQKTISVREELNQEKANLEVEKEQLRLKQEQPSEKALMEENLKKIRDDCLNTLRQRKEEINSLKITLENLKQELDSTTDKYNLSQQELNKVSKEKAFNEKESLKKINQIETQKDQRIKELENLLTTTISKIKN